MHNKHIQAAALPLLALILIIFSPQSFAASSEPNAVLEAAGEGLAYLDVQLRSKGGKETLKLQFKEEKGLISGSITLPGEGADYEVTAYDLFGLAKYSGKGSIPPLLEGDAPLQLALPSANPEDRKNDGLIVYLSRERLAFEVKALDEPNNFIVELEATDPRGNPLKLDPNDVNWGITDPAHFELIPLQDRFTAVHVRPTEPGTGGNVIQAGILCITPPQVILCVANRVCRAVPLCTDPWVQISAGHSHTCALKRSGAAFCWGDNALAELGADKAETCIGRFGPKCSTRPLRVTCPAGAPCLFSQISAGHEFTVATDIKGDTWSWGRTAPIPKIVSTSNGSKRLVFEQITAGDAYGCGIVKGGEVWCWGENDFGQAGAALPMNRVPFNAAVRVLSAFKFSKVAAAGQHTCAVITSGQEVACWGRDDSNQTRGPGATPFPLGGNQFFFQHFGGLTLIADVAVSAQGGCVKFGNGSGLNCWGKHSTLDLRAFGTPDRLAAGGDHVCAISAQQASCVGGNASGQLGIGSLVPQASPVAPNPPPTDLTSITAGTAHTCGLTPDGDAYCWGRSMEGQIGNGSFNWSVWEPALITVP